MRPTPTELIRIAKQVRKAIKPFYLFALFVAKQLENVPYHTVTTHFVYELIASFDDIKNDIMTAFGLETIRYEIQSSKIEPYTVVKEITKHAWNLIKMTEKILTKPNGKPIKLPTKDDLLNSYLMLEEHIILLIVWFDSYLRHMYN